MRYAFDKAQTPEGAKKIFESYRKKYPGTEKTVKDFYEAPEKGKEKAEKPTKAKRPEKKGPKPKVRAQSKALGSKLRKAPPKTTQKVKKSIGNNFKAIRKVRNKKDLTLGKKAVKFMAKKVGQNLGGQISGALSLTGGAPDGVMSVLGLTAGSLGGVSHGGSYGEDVGDFLVGKGTDALTRTAKKDLNTVKDYFSFSDSGPSRQARIKKLEKQNKSLIKKFQKASPKKAAEIRHRVGTNLNYIKNLSEKRSLGEKATVAVAKRIGQNLGGFVSGMINAPKIMTGPAGTAGAIVSALDDANRGGKYAEDLARWMIGEGAPAETLKKDVKDKIEQATGHLKTLERFINSAEKAMERLAADDEKAQEAFMGIITFLMENRPDLIAMMTDDNGDLDEAGFEDIVNGIMQGKPPQPSAPGKEVSEEELQQAVLNLVQFVVENRPEVIEEVTDEDGNFDEAAFDQLADKLLGGEESPSKKKASLRKRLIKAAYDKPELRPALRLLWK